MLEPVSVTALCLAYAALAPYASGGSAVSAEASKVGEAASAVLRTREESQSLFGQKAFAISRLRSAVADVIPDSDQQSANPEALWNAEQFLRALPDDLALPEFSVDPDGAIAMDWIQSRTRMFSISVSGSERLAYAWLDGSDRGHGVARFRSPVAPQQIVSLIQSIVADDNSVLRVA